MGFADNLISLTVLHPALEAGPGRMQFFGLQFSICALSWSFIDQSLKQLELNFIVMGQYFIL